jgi:hypothetical protein
MRIPCLLCGFIVGVGLGMVLSIAIGGQEHKTSVPAAEVLEGWTVVREDETLVRESPAVFVRAKQIESP